jgi:hypothetical protein
MMKGVVCKNPDCPRQGKPFVPQRAGAQYCSGRCRTAAHRKRYAPPPAIWWDDGKELRFSAAPSKTRNADGTPALTRGELAERLLEIASDEDGGKPKTGRRYWYLALSHGYVAPDMSDTAEGKESRAKAQKRISDILGVLRKQGRLSWDMVIDQWQMFGSPREARADLRRSYDEDRWLEQEYYPIFIVEKDSLLRSGKRFSCRSSAGMARIAFSSSPQVPERRPKSGKSKFSASATIRWPISMQRLRSRPIMKPIADGL